MHHLHRLPRGRHHVRPSSIIILGLAACLGLLTPSTQAESEDRGKNGKLRLRFADIDNEGPVNRHGWHFATRSKPSDRPRVPIWNAPFRIELLVPFRFPGYDIGRRR